MLLVAFFSLIILMIIHEFGHFIIAKKFGVKVEEFGIGYPPRIFGKQFGETLYSVNLVPLGAFVKIYGEEGLPAQAGDVDDYRSFSNLLIWKRILICLGGVIAFWIAAAIIFSVVFYIGADVPIGDQNIPGINDTRIQILEVQKDSPADMAGIQSGDELVGFNTVADFKQFVQESKGKSVVLNIKRNSEAMSVSLIPRVSYPADQGPTGVSLERIAHIIKRHAWYEAPFQGILYTGEVTWKALVAICHFFAGLFNGTGVPKEAQLAGPIGITIFLSRAVEYGTGFFLYFIGSLTVLLAIFNLFPIPALDGGKLIFLIIEKIMKKPVPVKWEQGITIFCFVALISMSLFITVKFDIPRVVDFWKAG